ncbi:Pogo transposable element [Mycena sanguinolenta]|uniref:Pogo transposable element n=1 Tax=Mycena sanguinolenta TaxID=230812 RepID=A0A8H7DCA6_9AGAR|nr:Pogo transposable element [Mycena sanguinolenta]
MSTLVFSIPTFNITIPVPEGTSDHGNPSILCTPTNWTSILSFFFGNYIAHAATTLASPGEELFEYALAVVMVLLFPSAGVDRGLDAIFRCAVFAKDDLTRAARAGALCMVIRTDEQNQKIPAGADAQSVVICTSQQTAKLLVAVWQTLYGAATLYRARGDQLARYGYAAFALTVIPYTVMSIVNLLGALLTPSYPTMYLVRSEVMDELDDGPEPYFDGTVGVLEPAVGEQAEQQVPLNRPYRFLPDPGDTALLIVLTVSVGIPLAIIGGLTKFKPGNSTHSQRVWLMMWLGFGSLGALFSRIPIVMAELLQLPFVRFYSTIIPTIPNILLISLVYSVPAIGGMVVVGKMIKEYGDCIRFD